MFKKILFAATLFSFSACFAAVETQIEKPNEIDEPDFDFSKHLDFSFRNQTNFSIPKSGPKSGPTEKIESKVWDEWKQKDGKVTFEPCYEFSYHFSTGSKKDKPKEKKAENSERGFRHSWKDKPHSEKNDRKPDFHVSYEWEWGN